MKKKKAVMAALAVMTVLTAAGCAKSGPAQVWDARENSIYVTKTMEVESAMIYTSEKANDLYTQEGLSGFAKEAVAGYNASKGAAADSENTEGAVRLPVALKSCTLEGQTGTLVFTYGTPEDFAQFAQEYGDNTHSVTSLSVGPMTGIASQAGFGEARFLTAAGKEADAAEVTKQQEDGTIAIEGAATVYTEGKIKYVTDGCTVRDEHCVSTPEGTSYIVFQ